jgi:uncharacterized membrane protein
MHWLVLVFINVIAIAVANLYQKIAMREEKSDAIAAAMTFHILTGVCYAIFAFVKGFQIPDISLAPYFLASMALYAVGTVYFFRAIKQIEASEMSIITGTGPVITIVASIIFLKDVLTPGQLLGAACILAAVILINFKKGGVVINQGTWLALFGTACYGTAIIFDTIIIRAFDAVSFIPIGSFGTAILMCAWYPKKIPIVIQSLKKVDKNLFIYSLLYAIAAIGFYLAIEMGALVGQVSSIARCSIVLTVILSSVLLKERQNMSKKIVGAILTTIGVILVSS